ncbi:MAG: VWA domain-containing protein, partial [Aquisalinus sp.]|nr:VWA domain-containing protein [Aquisalinus sp.]
MRQIIKSLYDQLSGFLKGTSGSISTLFSFMMLPLVAVLGVSVDLVQQGMMRVEVEQAADAALLAATRVINVEPDAEFSKMQQIATQQFSANLENPSSLNVVKLLFGRDPDTGQTNLDVEVRIKTNFISIFGLQETSIKTKPTAFASVETESSPNVDMVMVVDVSGSMSGSKINALRNAATDLTNIILPEGHQESRIGIVPFNSGVVNPWVLDLTSDVPSILDGISALNAGGGTNSFAGIQRGQTIMEDGDTPTYESHRKVVILLTD